MGDLLLLFEVQRVPAKAWAVLLQLQLLTPRLTDDGVVVISRLLADEENGFGFFLALGHGESALRYEGPPEIGWDLIIHRVGNYAELNPFSASLEGPVPPDRFFGAGLAGVRTRLQDTPAKGALLPEGAGKGWTKVNSRRDGSSVR